MEAIASTLTIAAAATAVSKTTNRHCHDYKNASKQALHTEQHHCQMRSNQALLNDLPPPQKANLDPAIVVLKDIEDSLSEELRLKGRSDRLRWALCRKKEVEGNITKHSQIETSMILNLLLSESQRK